MYFSAALIFSAVLCFAVPVITNHWVPLRGQLEEDCVDGASAGFPEVANKTATSACSCQVLKISSRFNFAAWSSVQIAVQCI